MFEWSGIRVMRSYSHVRKIAEEHWFVAIRMQCLSVYWLITLNKKIAPPVDKSGEKNLKQHSQEVKAKAEPDNQNQKLQDDAQKDKLEKKDESNKQK